MKPTHTTIATWMLAASLGAAGGLAHAQAATGNTAASAAQQAVSAPATATVAAPALAAPTAQPAVPAMPAMPAQSALVSVEQAIAAAQKQHPGSTVKDIDMEGKHGIMVYEIELASGWREYKVKVDAATGKVLTSRFEGIAWFD